MDIAELSDRMQHTRENLDHIPASYSVPGLTAREAARMVALLDKVDRGVMNYFEEV